MTESNDKENLEDDYSSMKTGCEDDQELVDFDELLDGFDMGDIDQTDLDYDANNDSADLEASVQEKIRMAMAGEELSTDTKDKDLILMAAAQRIALRRGIPRIPAVFGNPAKCKEFVANEMKGFPPPTHGMLETAKKVFEIGDMAGLAISSMEDCRKYLLSKAKNDSPTPEMLDSAFGLSNHSGKVIPPATLISAEELKKWILEHE
jgi:hypothetical protein